MSDTNVAADNDAPLDEAAQDNVEDIAHDVAEASSAKQVDAALQEANERALRAQAELENFRKRARREMDEQRQYANSPLMADLLPALDNLDRAVQAAEKTGNSVGLVEGVKMVAAHVLSILEQHHCRPIKAEGEPFDPHLHEAIAQEASDELPAGSVTRVLQTGYQLHDRVVRPSQVMVSTGPPAATEANNDSGGDADQAENQ